MHVQRSKETLNFKKNPTKQSNNIPPQRANYLTILFFKNSQKLFITDRILKNTSWDILKYEIHINAAEFPFSAEVQRLKSLHLDGREQFPQYLPRKSARKNLILPTTKWQSQRVLGNQPFPESSTAHSQCSRSQKQGTTPRSWDSAVQDWRQEAVKRSSEQKPCPCRKETMFWNVMAAELKTQSSETLKRADKGSSGASSTGNIQGSV